MARVALSELGPQRNALLEVLLQHGLILATRAYFAAFSTSARLASLNGSRFA